MLLGYHVPFLGHHEQPLHEDALRDLGSKALKQRQRSFMLNNVGHDLDETLEVFALPCWWWSRLQAYFSNN